MEGRRAHSAAVNGLGLRCISSDSRRARSTAFRSRHRWKSMYSTTQPMQASTMPICKYMLPPSLASAATSTAGPAEAAAAAVEGASLLSASILSLKCPTSLA